MYSFLDESTIWISLIISGIVYLSFLLKRDSRIKSYIEKLPGPKTLPVLGNALSLNVPNHELFAIVENWVDEFRDGGLFRLWLVNKAYVICSSADVVEKILSSTVHIEKSDDYNVLHPWLGTGLLTAAGKKWFSRRKLLTPAFHFKILEDFVEIFNDQSRVLTDVLKTERCEGEKFDIFPYVTRCALDIICETAMGKKVYAQRKQKHATSYVDAIYGINDALIQKIVKIWLRIPWLWKICPQGRAEKRYLKILHKYTENVIEERKRERRSEKIKSTPEKSTEEAIFETKKKKAFLDLLLDVSEEGKVLSDVDIREEVDTFMFEGHDTTSANINFTLFLLACYPTYQRRVQQELDEIFGSDNDRDVTSNDMAKMKFLECCIKESLRLYPSVPIITRTLKQDLLLQKGKQITIPAGTTAVVIPYTLHRDATVFPDPKTFDPERFLPENAMGRNPFAYVPFSAGPRNCIGQKFALMEEKVVLTHVLRKFQLEAVDSMESIELLPDIILRPRRGLHIKISERK